MKPHLLKEMVSIIQKTKINPTRDQYFLYTVMEKRRKKELTRTGKWLGYGSTGMKMDRRDQKKLQGWERRWIMDLLVCVWTEERRKNLQGWGIDFYKKMERRWFCEGMIK